MKRALDLSLILALTPWLILPLCLISLAIWVTSSGPIFFWSARVGKHGRLFQMPKFRSMKVDTPVVATHDLKNPNMYVTTVGSFLRKTSLDELPQLWNIVKGEMSFVGPRPALFNQCDLIALRKIYGVDEVLPGLTGWAQVNGRDELPIEKKVELDREYIQRKSTRFDLYILLVTFVIVLKRRGISH